MASSAFVKLACALVMCFVVAAPLAEAAINCGLVSGKVGPCISFLKGGPGPSGPCCAGIKSLNQAAATPADRKTACNCLKTASRAISGINYGKAASLPGMCGVKIPYAISPNTNCNAIH
ncbi:non-specific lipid-transfer protein-like [Chenopodium quinoa]|uniref:Non-specific lipid-transfer protein n=1 Tax=Chenopodium quinoa TaxID=63459 RepID=A0A803L3E3_CHEQI|nr:non-specific lipid-transfer protein-like [Chenopodium quinoa]